MRGLIPMKICAAIGEALIDFIPAQKGCALKDVTSFERVCGGAPCNVAAAVAKLGGRSRMITQLGKDAFGDYIEEVLNGIGADTSSILRTDKANTSLAFVSLKADGDRDFSFYRKPGADMLFEPSDFNDEWLSDAGILHFCSVALVESPMKRTHIKAIETAEKNGAVISFDPNIRLPLWDNPEECRATVKEFCKYADILKISDEELEFVTGCSSIETAVRELFEKYGKLKAVLFSKGKDGAEVITRNGIAKADAVSVKAADTTGAGDSIIGAFLYCLLKDGITPARLAELPQEKLNEYIGFANYYSSLSVTRKGAIASYGTLDELNDFIVLQKEG